jgi:hypothetical protein
MRGTEYEAVVFHRECSVTKQMQQDSARSKSKKGRYKVKYIKRKQETYSINLLKRYNV